jgi:hypothetical protein
MGVADATVSHPTTTLEDLFMRVIGDSARMAGASSPLEGDGNGHRQPPAASSTLPPEHATHDAPRRNRRPPWRRNPAPTVKPPAKRPMAANPVLSPFLVMFHRQQTVENQVNPSHVTATGVPPRPLRDPVFGFVSPRFPLGQGDRKRAANRHHVGTASQAPIPGERLRPRSRPIGRRRRR